jgi:hypothetical protein
MIRYLLTTPFEKDANIGARRVALPSCLVIAPVRELAQQIHVEAAKVRCFFRDFFLSPSSLTDRRFTRFAFMVELDTRTRLRLCEKDATS